MDTKKLMSIVRRCIDIRTSTFNKVNNIDKTCSSVAESTRIINMLVDSEYQYGILLDYIMANCKEDKSTDEEGIDVVRLEKQLSVIKLEKRNQRDFNQLLNVYKKSIKLNEDIINILKGTKTDDCEFDVGEEVDIICFSGAGENHNSVVDEINGTYIKLHNGFKYDVRKPHYAMLPPMHYIKKKENSDGNERH